MCCAGASLAQPAAPTAMVRVACDGPAVGAEVSINGVAKGECPVMVPVVAGPIELRVVKPVDATRERVFVSSFRIVADTVKRVDVELGAPQLNAAGQREEAARQSRLKEQADREAAALRASRLALVARANAGELPAMLEMAHWIAKFEFAPLPEGSGERRAYQAEKAANAAAPSADPVMVAWYQGAEHWYRRVAEAGDPAARFFLLPGWHDAPPWLLGLMRGMVNESMPALRDVKAEGLAAITALVDSDPFFRVGDAKGVWNADQVWDDRTRESRRHVCHRDKGQVFSISGEQRLYLTPNFPNVNSEFSLDHTAALGGLVTLSYSRTRFFDRTKWQLHAIDAVYGQPFPLGKRFGLRFRRDAAGPAVHLHCTSYDHVNKATQARSKGGAICFETDGQTSIVQVMNWHAPSGCFQLQPAAWQHPAP